MQIIGTGFLNSWLPVCLIQQTRTKTLEENNAKVGKHTWWLRKEWDEDLSQPPTCQTPGSHTSPRFYRQFYLPRQHLPSYFHTSNFDFSRNSIICKLLQFCKENWPKIWKLVSNGENKSNLRIREILFLNDRMKRSFILKYMQVYKPF